MEEEEARTWLASRGVSRETLERLTAFAAYLRDENRRQNLVSSASLDSLWTRHIVDSAQLLSFSPSPEVSWLDLGTGAGFPGLIVAALHQGPVTLVEARPLRVAFLRQAAEHLGIGNRLTILCSKVERVDTAPFEVISARAFAPLGKLLTLSHRFSTAGTRWILPKGRNAAQELEDIRASWQGEFRLEKSLTDDEAGIIIATGVRPRTGKKAR